MRRSQRESRRESSREGRVELKRKHCKVNWFFMSRARPHIILYAFDALHFPRYFSYSWAAVIRNVLQLNWQSREFISLMFAFCLNHQVGEYSLVVTRFDRLLISCFVLKPVRFYSACPTGIINHFNAHLSVLRSTIKSSSSATAPNKKEREMQIEKGRQTENWPRAKR